MDPRSYYNQYEKITYFTLQYELEILTFKFKMDCDTYLFQILKKKKLNFLTFLP